jgi:hypothetical protein
MLEWRAPRRRTRLAAGSRRYPRVRPNGLTLQGFSVSTWYDGIMTDQ